MRKINIKVLLILLAVPCFSAALEQLVIPKGLTMPYLQKSKQLQPNPISKKALRKSYKFDDSPPKTIISKSMPKKEAYTIDIVTNAQIDDTSHVAVLLKRHGLRLFKKRTLANQNHWYYWVKSTSGAPLYKIQLTWRDQQHKRATIHFWSWDDKDQLDLTNFNDVISIFGKPQA